MGLIWTRYERPEPNEEVMRRYREELQSIDSLLDIKWVENIRYNAEHRSFEGAYAVVCHFPSDDPRRALFQRGEMDNDYEIICWLTKDTQDAGTLPADPSEVWPKVLATLASADNTKAGWKVRMAKAAEKNLKMREQRKKDFLDGFVHDEAEYNRRRNLGIPMVNVPVQLTKGDE